MENEQIAVELTKIALSPDNLSGKSLQDRAKITAELYQSILELVSHYQTEKPLFPKS